MKNQNQNKNRKPIVPHLFLWVAIGLSQAAFSDIVINPFGVIDARTNCSLKSSKREGNRIVQACYSCQEPTQALGDVRADCSIPKGSRCGKKGKQFIFDLRGLTRVFGMTIKGRVDDTLLVNGQDLIPGCHGTSNVFLQRWVSNSRTTLEVQDRKCGHIWGNIDVCFSLQ